MLNLIPILVFFEKRVDDVRQRNGCISEMMVAIKFFKMEVYRYEASYSFNPF